MTIRLPEDLYEKLRREAFERHVPMITVITEALAARLNGEEGRS